MPSQIPAYVAWVLSLSSALIVAVISRWYDKFIERRYADKKRLTEAELAVTLEQTKHSSTSEGYLWKRIEALETANDALRMANNDLVAKLSKALDGDYNNEDDQHRKDNVP